MTHYTFITEGLTANQIKFLTECERLYFEDGNVSTQSMQAAFANCGFVPGNIGKECVEAWKYWTDQHFAIDRESYKSPVPLANIFRQISDNKGADMFWLKKDWDIGKGGNYAEINKEYFKELGIDRSILLHDLSPKEYYFELLEDGRLYLRYQFIIGSRLIAITKK